MEFSLKSVDDSVSKMDKIYDANFGEWIRNERNCRVVGANLRKYLSKYKPSKFIIVIKWIVKDWTLKSIIIFFQKFVIDGLGQKTSKEYKTRIEIIAGSIYTWNTIFISEFLSALTESFSNTAKADLYVSVLNEFENEKSLQILTHISNKIDSQLKALICEAWNHSVYANSGKPKRTNSVSKAFHIL